MKEQNVQIVRILDYGDEYYDDFQYDLLINGEKFVYLYIKQYTGLKKELTRVDDFEILKDRMSINNGQDVTYMKDSDHTGDYNPINLDYVYELYEKGEYLDERQTIRSHVQDGTLAGNVG